MSRVVVTAGARRGLERCRQFLADKNPRAATRAAETIARSLAVLQHMPEIGRPVFETPQLRELLIGFGDSGYIALYSYVETEDAVYVLAFRHQKEAGYGG